MDSLGSDRSAGSLKGIPGGFGGFGDGTSSRGSSKPSYVRSIEILIGIIYPRPKGD